MRKCITIRDPGFWPSQYQLEKREEPETIELLLESFSMQTDMERFSALYQELDPSIENRRDECREDYEVYDWVLGYATDCYADEDEYWNAYWEEYEYWEEDYWVFLALEHIRIFHPEEY